MQWRSLVKAASVCLPRLLQSCATVGRSDGEAVKAPLRQLLLLMQQLQQSARLDGASLGEEGSEGPLALLAAQGGAQAEVALEEALRLWTVLPKDRCAA